MSARVDKQWKDKGLAGYSTEAILGTLNHYGVALDEAGFKSLAAGKFPLELAAAWRPTWKGTGQFATYPYAAANELFNRLLPEHATPMKTAHVVLDVIANGLRLINGRDDANLKGAFEHWNKLAPSLPPKGERRDAFLQELVTFLETWAQSFNELPERLAKAGKKEEALEVAKVHEVLFTDREGCVTAIVRAHTGERESAVKELAAWADDGARDIFARYSALDALYSLDEFETLKPLGLKVFDEAAAQKKWSLADSIAHLLAHMVQKAGGEPGYLREVRERLDRAHQHTGGHH